MVENTCKSGTPLNGYRQLVSGFNLGESGSFTRKATKQAWSQCEYNGSWFGIGPCSDKASWFDKAFWFVLDSSFDNRSVPKQYFMIWLDIFDSYQSLAKLNWTLTMTMYRQCQMTNIDLNLN